VGRYRKQTRGGYGIIDIRATERNGKVVGVKAVKEDDQIMLITVQGMIMRMRVKHASVRGRGTQGVRLISLEAEDKLVSVAKLAEKLDESAEGRGPGLAVVPPPPEPEEDEPEGVLEDEADDETVDPDDETDTKPGE